MDHYKLFIDGEFLEADNGATFDTFDPGTGQAFATVSQAGQADVEKAIAAARWAFDHGQWSRMTPKARAKKLYDFADEVSAQSLRLTVTESMDAGHTIRAFSKYWGMVGSQILRNFAFTAAHEFPWEEEISVSGNGFSPGRDFIRREPYGVWRSSLRIPGEHGLLEDRLCHNHGKPDRSEARIGNTFDGAHYRRGRTGGGDSAGGYQRDSRAWRNAWKVPLYPPRCE